MTLNDFRDILGACSFPGCQFKLGTEDNWRPYLQIVADETSCARTGRPLIWAGRKWRLSPHMTRSEVVQTALMAVLAASEHEARERFRYRDRPIFAPHFNVDRLVELCEEPDAEEKRTAP